MTNTDEQKARHAAVERKRYAALSESEKVKRRRQTRAYRRRWLADLSPKEKQCEKAKAIERVKKFRESNPEKYNAYFREYFKANPHAREAQTLRTQLNDFRKRGDAACTLGSFIIFGYLPSELSDHLHDRAKVNGINPNQITVDHIVSLSLFAEFGCLHPGIVHDLINLDALSLSENTRKQAYIDDKVVAKAIELETKYPEELKGFIQFVLYKQAQQSPRDMA